MELITSMENKQIKRAASLKQKKFRDKEGLFLAEGVRLIEAALLSADIKECFVTREAAAQTRCAAVLKALEGKCCLYEISEQLMKKLSDTESPQGIIAVAAKKELALSDLKKNKKQPAFVILDRLQDPGNVGTILRTVEATGIDGLVTIRGTADIFSPKTVRASMGAVFHLPIADKVTLEELKKFIARNKIKLFATSVLPDSTPCFAADYTNSCALILGSEAEGIGPELTALADESIFIPMHGKSESLNASAAAAMLMYEVMRQRFVS